MKQVKGEQQKINKINFEWKKIRRRCVCMHLWVRYDSSPPVHWSERCYSSSSSQRWGLPSGAPPLWPAASSEPSAWQLIGWELQGRAAAVAPCCSQKRGCLPLQRSLGPAWGCGERRGFGWPWGLRKLLLGTSDHPGTRRKTTTQVWTRMSSAGPSFGSRPLSAGASAETPAASVSAASAAAKLRWTEEEPRLHLWMLKRRKQQKQLRSVCSWFTGAQTRLQAAYLVGSHVSGASSAAELRVSASTAGSWTHQNSLRLHQTAWLIKENKQKYKHITIQRDNATVKKYLITMKEKVMGRSLNI